MHAGLRPRRRAPQLLASSGQDYSGLVTTPAPPNELTQVVQLLLQQEAGHGGRQELGHALGGGVGAVGSAEGVVHVDVGVLGQLQQGQQEGMSQG